MGGFCNTFGTQTSSTLQVQVDFPELEDFPFACKRALLIAVVCLRVSAIPEMGPVGPARPPPPFFRTQELFGLLEKSTRKIDLDSAAGRRTFKFAILDASAVVPQDFFDKLPHLIRNLDSGMMRLS